MENPRHSFRGLKESFFNNCVLSQCIVRSMNILKVYSIVHFQNIHTFTYQKTLLHTLFCLFLKPSKAFSVSLRMRNFQEIILTWTRTYRES